MEKVFNDDELADIMNEIEALEGDLTQDYEDDVSMSGSDGESDIENQEHSEQKHTEVEKIEVLKPKVSNKNSHSSISSSSAHPCQMKFKVEGEMHIDLEFEIDGEIVSVALTSEGLKLTMNQGASFTLPRRSKKAA